MVSRHLVDQNLSRRKMVEGTIAISTLISCQKSLVPKGEQRGYQSLHERRLHKHTANYPATPAVAGKRAREVVSDSVPG